MKEFNKGDIVRLTKNARTSFKSSFPFLLNINGKVLGKSETFTSGDVYDIEWDNNGLHLFNQFYLELVRPAFDINNTLNNLDKLIEKL